MYFFFNLFFTFYFPNGSQWDVQMKERNKSFNPFFMLYSSFQHYIVIQSFHPLHHIVDVHDQQNTRNCRFSWKCNFDFDRQASTVLRDKAYFILANSQRILFRAASPFLIMDYFTSFFKYVFREI